MILTNVSVQRRGRDLLQSISLTLTPPGIVALIGPNGAGKSTLLRVLAGVIQPSKGRTVGPLDTGRQRSQIAYLPQHTPMPFGYTVAELVGLSDSAYDRRDAALAAMELESLRDTPVDQLSGGERQRAAIARVLAQEGPWILLDEPFVSLDLRYQQRLEATLRIRAQGGACVVVALHDLNQARRLADRVIALHQGQIAQDGTPEQVVTPALLHRVFGVDRLSETPS